MTVSSEQLRINELESIRLSGTLAQINRVFDILRENHENKVGREAVSLIADVKDEGMIDILIHALEQKENESIKAELIQACWESGLNYSAHLLFFTDLFLDADYREAVEAFSLIETTLLDFAPDEQIKNKIIDRIKQVVLDMPDHRQNLAMELMSSIKNS